jgi:hypothetical protein
MQTKMRHPKIPMTATPKKGAAANARPAFPLGVLGDFGSGLCAPPFRPAHVAELGR